jgi:REP element-mobilizing transposase RayT
MKQLKFKADELKLSRPFGGSLLRKAGNRTARPLSTKKSMHLVLRSTQATGEWSFKTKRNNKIVNETLHKTAQRFGVRIYQFSNNGNHLHLLIRLGNRFAYRGFIRALTGTLAIKITAANKFNKLKKRFWDARPFSRVIEWGRAYNLAKDYLLLNQLESQGIFDYAKNRLRDVILHPFDLELLN